MRWGSKKNSDRACKFFALNGLRPVHRKQAAYSIESEEFTLKVLKNLDLAVACWAGGRVSKYSLRLMLLSGILLIVYGMGARLEVTEGGGWGVEKIFHYSARPRCFLNALYCSTPASSGGTASLRE